MFSTLATSTQITEHFYSTIQFLNQKQRYTTLCSHLKSQFVAAQIIQPDLCLTVVCSIKNVSLHLTSSQLHLVSGETICILIHLWPSKKQVNLQLPRFRPDLYLTNVPQQQYLDVFQDPIQRRISPLFTKSYCRWSQSKNSPRQTLFACTLRRAPSHDLRIHYVVIIKVGLGSVFLRQEYINAELTGLFNI